MAVQIEFCQFKESCYGYNTILIRNTANSSPPGTRSSLNGDRQKRNDTIHRDTCRDMAAINLELISVKIEHSARTVVHAVAACGHQTGDVLSRRAVGDAVVASRADRGADEVVTGHKYRRGCQQSSFRVWMRGTHRPML